MIGAISFTRREIGVLMVWRSSEKALCRKYPAEKRLGFGYLLPGRALWKLGTFQMKYTFIKGNAKNQVLPWSSMAFATLINPAIFAPLK